MFKRHMAGTCLHNSPNTTFWERLFETVGNLPCDTCTHQIGIAPLPRSPRRMQYERNLSEETSLHVPVGLY
jgi:hypothetical protein